LHPLKNDTFSRRTKGNWREAGINFAGDVASLLGGGAGLLEKCSKGRRIALAVSVAGEAGVAGVRGTQAVLAFRNGETGEGLGHAGEAILRLIGVGANTIALIKMPCFPAGTPIRTAHGHLPIEEVKTGDLVLSRDQNDPVGIVSLKRVSKVFRSEANLWQINVAGQSVRTTANHPFYACGRGWIGAGKLVEGDELLTEDGRWLSVTSACDTQLPETVFNLMIEDYHTYFVGADEWGFSIWAHNICGREVKALLADSKLNPKNVKLSSKESRQIAGSLNSNGEATQAIELLKSKGYSPEQAKVIAGELKVSANQAKHDLLVKNQQKELIAAIEAAPAKGKEAVRGRILQKQGARYEETTRSTLKQIPDAKLRPHPKLASGEGGILDNVIEKGSKTVYVESKYSLSEVNDRMVNQITHAVKKMDAPGERGITVFLDVARKPTAKELAALEARLGPEVFSKIKDNIVSSQTELFKRVKTALR